MTCSSKPWTPAELASIRIGYDLHRRVIEDGKRDCAGRTDGTKVFAYLDHDLIGSGSLPFVKYDQRTGEISRKFSSDIAADIRRHVGDLKVYFRYVTDCDSRSAPPAVGSSGRSDRRGPTGGNHL